MLSKQLNLYFLHVGPRLDFDDAFQLTSLDSYFLVNLSGSYRVSERWELFARLDNVLDEQYEEVFGFATPGISAFAGANIRW